MVWRHGLDLSGAVDKPGTAFIQTLRQHESNPAQRRS
jgi:hypothetical protein